MNGKLVERCFVNLVLSMLMEDVQTENPRYKSQGDFSKAAFPNEPNHTKIWQAIKQGQKNSARRVSIEEAYSIAHAVGENVERLLIKSEMLIEEGWTLAQDVYYSEQAKQPGRPKKNQKREKNDVEKMPEVPTGRPIQPSELGASDES